MTRPKADLLQGIGLLLEEAPIDLVRHAARRAAGGPMIDGGGNHVTRRQRTFRYRGAEIELALDQGEVTDGTGRSPICETHSNLRNRNRNR